MLLSNRPVEDLGQALERLRWYACRWNIEVFHRTLKSGCKIEERQLGTADRLEACLAIDMVVAWRIQHLTWFGRAVPDMPCTVAFDDDQWKAIFVFKTRKPPPQQPPTLSQMIVLVASPSGSGCKGWTTSPPCTKAPSPHSATDHLDPPHHRRDPHQPLQIQNH
jgi:hypothetical protein